MRFIVRIGLLLIGISLCLMSTSLAFARRERPLPQLAATVITTTLHDTKPHYDIFLVHAESGLRRRITFGNGVPDSVKWTVDGQWLSFYESETYGTGRFLRVDWRGDNATTIASDGAWFSRQGPSSPDSKWQVWIGLNRTIYLYSPEQGTDALIDSFGEQSQGVRSSQRAIWSADSRWLYIVDVWRYSGDRILGPDTNIIDLDYFIYRIDMEQQSEVLLVSERASVLQGVEIGPEWIVYAHGGLNSQSVWRLAVDGSDRNPITFTTIQNLNYPLFWAMPSGDVIVLQEHIAGAVRRYVFTRFNAETSLGEVLSIDGISAFQAVQVPSWSADHRFIAFVAQTINNERRLVILSEDGTTVHSAPVELCNETLPIWQHNTLYILEHAVGLCHIRAISTENGTSTISFRLPKDVLTTSIVDDIEPNFIKYDDTAGLNLVALDGSQTIRLADTLNGDIVSWSWLPLETHSYRWAAIISLACIMTLLLAGYPYPLSTALLIE